VPSQPAARNAPALTARPAIRPQVEFYFSEQNLAKDKFMKVEMAKPESDGWVAIKVLGTFNRMKVLPSPAAGVDEAPPCRWQPRASPLPLAPSQELNPSGDASEVASALAGSEVVEVSECKAKLRRLPHLSKKSVTLGGKPFSSRAEVIGFARPLLDSKAELEPEGASFVTDLLSHHAKAAEKIGVGIKSIKPGCNPKWPETKCFMLVRTDGTEEDFSYIKCGTFPRRCARCPRMHFSFCPSPHKPLPSPTYAAPPFSLPSG
jgi:hypothetical protein